MKALHIVLEDIVMIHGEQLPFWISCYCHWNGSVFQKQNKMIYVQGKSKQLYLIKAENYFGNFDIVF